MMKLCVAEDSDYVLITKWKQKSWTINWYNLFRLFSLKHVISDNQAIQNA